MSKNLGDLLLTEEALIGLSDESPDRMMFYGALADGLLAHYEDDDKSPLWLDDDEELFVYLSDVRKVQKAVFDLLEPDDDLTRTFFDDCLMDAEWHGAAKYQTPSHAWYMRDRIIVQGRFSLTLNLVMLEHDARLNYWSQEMKSWIIVDPTEGASSLEDIFDLYNITPSPYLESLMEGAEEWREILDGHAQTALDEGYRAPDIFPTDRTLKEHQKTGVLAMVGLRQSLLADQVGLGKSGEFISAYLSIVQKKIEDGVTDHSELWPCVIATKKSLKYEVAEEIALWKKDAVVEILEGYADTEIPEDTEFIVLNVDLLSQRLDNIMDNDPKALVIDEAHSMKNQETKRTKAAQSLSDYIYSTHGDESYLCMASGTPFQSRPSDLWSLLCILHVENIFGSYAMKKVPREEQTYRVRARGGKVRRVPLDQKHAFDRRWCNGFDDRYGNWYNFGSDHEIELNTMLRENVMVRRRKSDIMHPLPMLYENIVSMPLFGEAAHEYAEINEQFREWLMDKAVEEAEKEGIDPKVALRSVASKLSFEDNEKMMQITQLRQSVARGKINSIIDWINRFMEGDPEITGGDETRSKLIVFAHHQEIQRLLIEDERLQRYGLVSIVAGKDPQAAKKAFQEDPRCRLVICYSGATEGHTLTSAKDVLVTELPFLHTAVIQMAGRCWARISELYEPHEAWIHLAVAPDTIDSAIIGKLLQRRARFNATIDGEGEDLEKVEELTDEESGDLITRLLAMPDKVKVAA